MNNEPKILVKHSRIEINDYTLGDNSYLEYIFSVWDPKYHKSFPKGIEYNEEKHKLILPRGIDIPYIENQFKSTAVVDRKCDPYVNTEQIPIKYLPRDERQMKILKFILGKEEYSYTKTKSQISCNSTTGSGKTFVTVAAICFSGARSIIITNSLDWLKQWEAKIMEYTPLTTKDIYFISGSTSINKILNRDPLRYKIFLASHNTIKSYGDRNGWDKVEELFKYLKCSFKIYDEAHLYFDNLCKIDFHSNTKKTLYLTATPQRSNKDEDNIYQLYFKNIPSIELLEEQDAHVNYIAMHFNSHPHPQDIQKCKNVYGFDRIAYANYVVNKENFMHIVNILIDLVLGINGKVLIYIGTNNAITVVYNYIISQFPFLRNNVGIYTSMVKENKYNELCKKIILSTTKSCGAASDIKDLSVTINLAEPFKSPVLARQTLGRCRKDNSLYIDIVDNGFFYTKKYYEAKKPIFSRYAKSCKDVVFSDNELEGRSLDIVNKYSTGTIICTKVYKE